MQKNKIISILLACAVIFSGFAAFLIYHYMSPTRATIFVFNSDYSAGTLITESMLKPLQVDASMVSGGSSTNVDTAFVTPADYGEVVRSGDSLRMDVSEGMPFINAMRSVTGGSKIEMRMQSGSIAVTIPVDNITGVTNDLKDGSYVNIYATDGNSTTMIQQKKLVLEVFRSEGSITGVSIEENKQESMELINAATQKSIYLGLIGNGYQVSEGSDDPVYNAPASEDEYADDTSGISSYLAEVSDAEMAEEEETEADEEEQDASGVFGDGE